MHQWKFYAALEPPTNLKTVRKNGSNIYTSICTTEEESQESSFVEEASSLPTNLSSRKFDDEEFQSLFAGQFYIENSNAC